MGIQLIDDVARIQSLLNKHSDLFRAEAQLLGKALDGVLDNFLAARKKWQAKQRLSADDFNLFELMELEGDELNHSRLLAWLLDHRLEQGTHAQGGLGFRLFLAEFARDMQLESSAPVYADETDYWVSCEVSGDSARIDIEIAARNKFLIHIENKIHACEGDGQTKREWNDLQDRAASLGVPKSSRHGLFLTLDATKPSCARFSPIGWHRIARVFDQFALVAEPPAVKLFASHYATALRKLAAVGFDDEEVSSVDV